MSGHKTQRKKTLQVSRSDFDGYFFSYGARHYNQVKRKIYQEKILAIWTINN